MTAYRKIQFQQWLSEYDLHGKKVLEVGCGRGEFIDIMQAYDVDIYGIESGLTSVLACKEKNINVEQGFMDKGFIHEQAPFDGFYILNFLEHLPDINENLKSIADNLTEGAIGLIEVPNFDMMLRESLFSEVISDHIYYFTEKSLRNTLEFNGFEVVELNCIWHDYIISVVVRKRPKYELSGFISGKQELSIDISCFIEKYEPKRIAIWGAGHQSLAIMSLTNLNGKIRYVVDSANFKQGKYTPVTHIPIVAPEYLNSCPVEVIIVIAGSYTSEVVSIIRQQFKQVGVIAIVEGNRLSLV